MSHVHAMPGPGPEPTRAGLLAAIDIGSNSFRLEIAQVLDGRYRRIDYLKEAVRLGGGLDADGMLVEDAARRGLDCLARFARRLEGFGEHQVRAVATQTLREAKNRDAFLVRAREVLGRPIEVISGREEARLIYVGVARLQPSERRRLVVDVGGRSTELILGRGTHPQSAESFRIGSVGLSLRYFGDGRFTESAFRSAQVAAGAELEEALETFMPGAWDEALGSSGTVGAVSQVLAASNISDGRIELAGLQWLTERCLEAGTAERLSLPGLKADRRAVIGGGLAVLTTLATNFGVDVLLPAKGALRQGVILELAARQAADSDQRSGGEDPREASVRELQQRFRVDVRHARAVSMVVQSLIAAVRPLPGGERRREMRWAAELHEVGMMISHHDHHRHSAYVLTHADAPGFSQSQMRRIGEFVLGHRGGLRKLDAKLDDATFALQLLCLRLAVLVCHARGDVQAPPVSLRNDGDSVRIGVAAGWAETHPRALHLLNEEIDAWTRSSFLQPTLTID